MCGSPIGFRQDQRGSWSKWVFPLVSRQVLVPLSLSESGSGLCYGDELGVVKTETELESGGLVTCRHFLAVWS